MFCGYIESACSGLFYLSMTTGIMREGGTYDPVAGIPITLASLLHIKDASSVARCKVCSWESISPMCPCISRRMGIVMSPLLSMCSTKCFAMFFKLLRESSNVLFFSGDVHQLGLSPLLL